MKGVFRDDFIPQSLLDPAPAVPVPQRDGDRLLGFVLADDKPVQFVHDLSRCQLLFVHLPCPLPFQTVSTVMFSLVYTQMLAAIFSAFSAISSALSSVFWISALAAASA